ncbi:MAG: DUF6356 family protein [Pseudomonadota bacterium]
MKNAFTKHPESVGETYTQHMGMAFSFGARLIFAGFACLVHGLFPFLFTTTGKDCIRRLHDDMVLHRDRRSAQRAAMPAMGRGEQRMEAAE